MIKRYILYEKQSYFSGMSSLESLNLGWNFLSSLSGAEFVGLSNLKQLYIYNNKLTALPDDVLDNYWQTQDVLDNYWQTQVRTYVFENKY